jgi:hypothetical protein
MTAVPARVLVVISAGRRRAARVMAGVRIFRTRWWGAVVVVPLGGTAGVVAVIGVFGTRGRRSVVVAVARRTAFMRRGAIAAVLGRTSVAFMPAVAAVACNYVSTCSFSHLTIELKTRVRWMKIVTDEKRQERCRKHRGRNLPDPSS